jgi:hypothetical protein
MSTRKQELDKRSDERLGRLFREQEECANEPDQLDEDALEVALGRVPDFSECLKNSWWLFNNTVFYLLKRWPPHKDKQTEWNSLDEENHHKVRDALLSRIADKTLTKCMEDGETLLSRDEVILWAKQHPYELPIILPKQLENYQLGTVDSRGEQPFEALKSISSLHPDDLTIIFASNDRLRITAKGKNSQEMLANVGLINNKTGEPNMQGNALLEIARKGKLPRNAANDKKISRLRNDFFKKYLGITIDPFHPANNTTGWKPLFKVEDKRGAADERAKRDAVHVSYNDNVESPSFEKEDDPGGDG